MLKRIFNSEFAIEAAVCPAKKRIARRHIRGERVLRDPESAVSFKRFPAGACEYAPRGYMVDTSVVIFGCTFGDLRVKSSILCVGPQEAQ